MKSRAICILGMHRSGTSVITRAINLLGAYLGEKTDLMDPGLDNPEGFWERNDIVDLHDRILYQFKKTWDALLPLPDQWYMSDKVKPFREELAEIISKHFLAHKLWAWKDPRNSILLPIWKDVLDELHVDLACLMAIRNPIDVAKSLEKRNGFPIERSLGIWFNYNLTALNMIPHIPFIFISYDRCLADWKSELKRCAIGLGVPWPGDDSCLTESMNKFIRPDLRHSISSLDDLKRLNAPSPAIELYRLLEGAISSSSYPNLSFLKGIEDLSKEFSSFARFFQDDMCEFFKLRHLLLERDIQLMEKDHHLHDKDRQLQEKVEQLQNMLNSRSWRITAPLRTLSGILKGLKRR